ncbi:MAG: uroporphyrinogen-III synthase [Bacteroidales bacterium]|nr:uroporphyrinogen-III synthase [Bacteroidales bacterium]
MTKIKRILVSQPKPESEKHAYSDLAEKNNLKIDFRPFIKVEGIDVKDFRKTRIDILAHGAVIFTSKTAIDHFFRLAEEMRITVPDDMKYFCSSESIAFYLQKYIVYRKRKIFSSASGNLADMMDVLQKHKDEHFLVPMSSAHKDEIPALLEKAKLKYTSAVLYNTVCTDLSDLSEINYDVLVFFSPSGIKSLLQNFPGFQQNDTKIATFGTSTAKAATEAGLRLDISAPQPNAPSMTMALEQYITEYNKNVKK